MSLSFCFTICHELVHLNPGLILLVIEVRFFDLLSWLTSFVMDFLNRSSKREQGQVSLLRSSRVCYYFRRVCSSSPVSFAPAFAARRTSVPGSTRTAATCIYSFVVSDSFLSACFSSSAKLFLSLPSPCFLRRCQQRLGRFI